MRVKLGMVAAGIVASACAVGQVTETGFGNMLYCNTLNGDFVVAGTSTRIREGAQTPVFTLALAGIPVGATVVAAYANWSYLGNNASANNTIIINGQATTGQKSGEGSRDLIWGYDKAFAYTADVTSIFTANGNYTISGATDSVNAQRIGEGLSVVVVYEHGSLVEKEVNVYDGYTSTTTGNAEADLNFCNAYGSDMKLFLNGIDGQEIFSDQFYANGFWASDKLGLGGADNPWKGSLGPGAVGRNYYDHLLGDASEFMTVGDTKIKIDTDGFDDINGYTDAVGHSFAAASFRPVPEPATLAALAVGLGWIGRRRRSSHGASK